MDLKEIKQLCQNRESIKLAYLFGSQANGDTSKNSDYDFAFYLDEKDPEKRFQTKLDLVNALSKLLETNKVDVVILNDAKKPELKYNIIQSGELLYEEHPYKVKIEPRIMNEYFDFKISLQKYGLTKAS